MQFKKTLLCFLLNCFITLSYAQDIIPLIPKPLKFSKIEAKFLLNNQTQMLVANGAQDIAQYFKEELLKSKGISLRSADKAKDNFINLQLNTKLKLSEEAYQLIMLYDKIEVRASHQKGLFAGVSSLLQLIKQQNIKKQSIVLQCWNIEDQPRYAWRGFMLDESRHFYGKEKVKQILDWMAFYKLNKFHWHLTDQPGWRIEIKAYPKLTLVGGIGTYTNPNQPTQYYTQEDIKEIVSYAAKRFIDVIPEIDMPGHATAANRAYPEYSGGGSKQHPEFTFNPGKESTYQYLTNILKEVDVLFPSQMIHIGADEVHYGNEMWKTDESVQQLMKDKNLKDLVAVEQYFVKRMADSIAQLNNEVLAWDEVVSGNLSKENTTIYWWRHDKPEVLKTALEKGYKVVMCPRLPLYFDFVQDKSLSIGRRWSGSIVELKNVYDFPSNAITDLPNAGNLIRGMQANLWTENLVLPQQIDFMIFPRIAALAESAWTAQPNKNYDEFANRLKKHLFLYNDDGINYYNLFNPKNTPELLTPSQRKKLPDNEGLTKLETQIK